MELGLPYGLSSFHRHACTTGKAAALQQEHHLFWQTLSLNMSSPGTRLPRETAHSAPSTSYSDSKAQKHLLKKLHKANLAVAESGALGAKVAEATVKKKRKRAANVESTQNWRLNTSDMSSKQKKLERSRKKPRSSSKRPGASKSRPITIDSDDNRDTEDNGESDGSVEILIRYVSLPVVLLNVA